MRISDWSSDVCSSDLSAIALARSDLGVGVQQTRIHQRFRRHARAVGVAKPRKAIVERQLIEGNGHGRVLLAGGDHCSRRSRCRSVGSAIKTTLHHDKERLHAFRQLRSEEHTSELQSLMRISYA